MTVYGVRGLRRDLGVSLREYEKRLEQAMSQLPEEAQAEAVDGPVETEPEAPAKPEYDTAKASTAHADYVATVNTAHETLSERLGNAYSIFSADLDRAYRVWEDVYNGIRQAAGLPTSSEGEVNVSEPEPDPANAR